MLLILVLLHLRVDPEFSKASIEFFREVIARVTLFEAEISSVRYFGYYSNYILPDEVQNEGAKLSFMHQVNDYSEEGYNIGGCPPVETNM